mgnify:CR=1 FL=1
MKEIVQIEINSKLDSINKIEDIIGYAKEHHLENLIAIDNTASSTFIENYISLAENSFDLISSNKVANTVSYDFYKKLQIGRAHV